MKLDFEQFMITWLIKCSKFDFWSTFISSNWIKSEFTNSLKQLKSDQSLKADQKGIFL